ncbi:MAG: AraC family transcriptional regulator [Paenibacillaceae bacterium]|nr:AraC family transcriptional regulator [Paenibacillaceae bacterium]
MNQAPEYATPTLTRLMEIPDEFCYEVPFGMLFDSLLYVGVAEQKKWYTPPHFHPHFELCYIVKGQGWFYNNSHFYNVKEGDLFLSKIGEVHYGAAAGIDSFMMYYLGFKLDQMKNLELDYIDIGNHRVVEDRTGTLKRMFDNIMEEIRSVQKQSMRMAQSLLIQLLITVLRNYARAVEQGKSSSAILHPAVRRTLERLHLEVNIRHNADGLCAAVHLSRSQLNRLFKTTLGTSISDYIRALYIDRAKYYLRETNDSVTEIAERMGFNTIHNFSMFFKKGAKMSPAGFRKFVRDKANVKDDSNV